MRFGGIIESVTSTGVRFLLAYGSAGTGTHEYARSPDGVAWTASSALPATPAANASMQLSDAIVWDGLIVAHGEGDQIFASVDGIAWQVDSAGVLDEHWRTGVIAIQFIGTAMAPWGASAIYFLNLNKLWVLDWYVYNAIEIKDLGDSNKLVTGTVWNGSIIVTDGRNVWEYNPGNAQTVRQIGLFGKDGPPTSWIDDAGHAGTSNDYHITQFIPGTGDLFALCRSLASPRTMRIAVYNGVGWSWFGPEIASAQPYGGIVDQLPTGLSLASTTRAIDIAALADQSNATLTLHTLELPASGDIPYYGGIQDFEDGPLSFETGWFDGGFAELEGALIRLAIDAYRLSANETVQVEYRLNNNETGAYINIGTFTNNQQEVWFGGPRGQHRGVSFKTVQFRITLDRGATTNRTPILKALILLFDKKPKVRTSWTIQVDVSRMIERKVRIGGEKATSERVWQFLKTLVNHPTLIELKVPSLESGGVNVRITDMPATVQDIRPAAGGRGIIDLQMIEIAS